MNNLPEREILHFVERAEKLFHRGDLLFEILLSALLLIDLAIIAWEDDLQRNQLLSLDPRIGETCLNDGVTEERNYQKNRCNFGRETECCRLRRKPRPKHRPEW